MKIKNLLFGALLLSSTLVFAQKSYVKTLQLGGLSREYRLYVPAKYDASKAAPLVFNFHGYGSTNVQQAFYANFNPIADTAGFILCFPMGTIGPTGQSFFNVGFFASPVDDVAFTNMMIDSISASFNINSKRIYATGLSNGGFMSYLLACANADKFAAIASVAGSMTDPMKSDCKPKRKIPIMEFHGTADATVPYNGLTNFQPVDSTLSFWLKNNNCVSAPTKTIVPNNPTIEDNLKVEHYEWYNGGAKPYVELYKILGGGHTWPGATFNIGVTSQDVNACNEIWRFFNSYSLNLVNEKNIFEDKNFKIFPNPTSDIISIESDINENVNLQVINLQGKVLIEEKNINPNCQINVEQIPSGIYFLKLKNANGQLIEKFIKR